MIPLFPICFHATLLTHQVNAQLSVLKRPFQTDKKPCCFKGVKGWSDYCGHNSDGKGNMTIYSKKRLGNLFLTPQHAVAEAPHCGSTSVAFTMLFKASSWYSHTSRPANICCPVLGYNLLMGSFSDSSYKSFPNLGLVDRMANHSKRNWECILLGSINQSSNMKMSPFNTTTMKTFQWKRARPSKIVK